MTDSSPNAAAFMKAMVDSAEEAVYICNAEEVVVDWNRFAEKLLGYSAQEIVGQRMTILIPAARLDEAKRTLDRVAQGERFFDLRTQRVRKDGGIVDVALTVLPVRDESGNFIGRIHILRPFSTFPLNPQLLLSAVVEYADDAIVTKSLDGIVTSWNPGAERIFGYSAAEMIDTPIAILMPEDQPDEESRILRRIRAGERIDHYETKRRRKDGSIIDISLTVSPIRDGNGTIVGASKIARDITERKRLEAREREAKRQAEALSRAKDDFIATVSHELRTPMTAILGWVRMLAGGQLGIEAQKKALQVIERNAKSQAQLIEDLLDMSRIISGKLKLKMKPVDPASFIGAVVESLRPTAETKSIRVQLVIDSSVKRIVGDEERLRQ